MITLIDYGVGNIQAFINIFHQMGITVLRAAVPDDFKSATKIILPGVGSFDHAMQKLNESKMRHALDYYVKEVKVPVLGVCVGMQMMASGSDEGILPGLDWIPGRVRAFPQATNLRLPHMGWNNLEIRVNSPLLAGLNPDPFFYFLHSYYFDCDDINHTVASTNYGIEFDSIISSKHIHGVQFHPEKSHHFGAKLLRNFSQI